jgi:hypothetical protein
MGETKVELATLKEEREDLASSVQILGRTTKVYLNFAFYQNL